jgi:hypothetical protein
MILKTHDPHIRLLPEAVFSVMGLQDQSTFRLDLRVSSTGMYFRFSEIRMSENISDREHDNPRFSSRWISGHIRALISHTLETQLHNRELTMETERRQFQRENE